MKTLFNEYFGYTEAGGDMDEEFSKVLEPIFSKYVELGYSPREIAEIFNVAVENKKNRVLKDFKDKANLKQEPQQYVILSRKKDGARFWTTHNLNKNYENEGYDVLGYTNNLADAEKI